jgi:hypothetical protein
VRALYRRLALAGLDRSQVFHIRDGAIDREDLHISFNDGHIALMEATDGSVNGAFFAGEGEILVVPPNHTERQSLALFTKSAVLSEKFTIAYIRFQDSHFLRDLAPSMLPAESPADFVQRYDPLVKNLAPVDALRLTVARLRTAPSTPPKAAVEPGEFIRLRLTGGKLGTFDVVLDTGLSEQIIVGQSAQTEHGVFYDQWMSFPMRSMRKEALPEVFDRTVITAYSINTQVEPPTSITADATLRLHTSAGGDRLILFELSRNLRVSSVMLAEGTEEKQLEFLQNEPIEGSQQQRLGNDIVAVALPAPLTDGQDLTLKFHYSGPVMSDAGGGLMYVGARGVWYPNRGLWMSNFDLEFRTPVGWKLLATGTPVSRQVVGTEEVSHWRSQRPIPVAGFNLGQYVAASATCTSGPVVDSYAAQGMDTRYTKASAQRLMPQPRPWWSRRGMVEQESMTVPATVPNPAKNAQAVAEQAARTIDFLAPRIGAFPFERLSLTQIPGTDSQGWPGLVYLSSFVFLDPQDRWRGRVNEDSPDEILFRSLMTAHETAHQWWGDAVFWKTYRDQWLMEALANYSALLKLEVDDPQRFRVMMMSYRDLLLKENDGRKMKDAGAVTLGGRLNSSKFHDSYDVIAYGRGTWLIHMIRHMLRDAAVVPRRPARGKRDTVPAPEDAPLAKDPDRLFFHFLRRVNEGFSGKVISTPDFQRVLEEELPPSLGFENRPSLDWFFDGWVGGVAVPKLSIAKQRVTNNAAGSTASAVLIQKDAPDLLVTSVPLYAEDTTGKLTFLQRVFADGEETALRFRVPHGTIKIVADPFHTVLRAD